MTAGEGVALVDAEVNHVRMSLGLDSMASGSFVSSVVVPKLLAAGAEQFSIPCCKLMKV